MPRSSWRLGPIALIGAILIAWTLFLRYFGPRNPSPDLAPPQLASPRVTVSAPFDWRLNDLDGRPTSLGQFRGRPIFVNIWATWCGPCVSELPAIDRLAANPRLKDVAFLAVSTEPAATVRGFLRDRKFALPAYVADDVPDLFQTPGIPATFLIAPDGRVVARQIGSAQWDDPTVVEYLERLTAPSPPSATPPAPAP